MEEVGRLFAARPEVSHCVEREGAPGWTCNLYTMIHARDGTRGGELIADMSRAAGTADYVVLETVRQLKRSSVKPPMW